MITDVRMPGMDGLELQRRVQRERPESAVILISAHVDEETRMTYDELAPFYDLVEDEVARLWPFEFQPLA